MPTFSIITVSYQAEQYLERCIQSVLSQEGILLEYIIIDGGSTDKTPEIIKTYEKELSYWSSEPDNGIYDAMNKGLARATGEIIGFLHADDYFEHTRVLAQVQQIFDRISEIDLVYGNIRYMKGNKCHRNWVSGTYKLADWHWGWMPPHTGTFCRKTVYTECGFFRTDFRISADYEFLLRTIYIHRKKAYYFNEYIVCMETGGTSNAGLSAKIRSHLEDWKAWFIHGIFFTLAPIFKPLRKLNQFHWGAPFQKGQFDKSSIAFF